MRKAFFLIIGLSIGCANPKYLDENIHLPQGSEQSSCIQRIADICTSITWGHGPSSQGENHFQVQFDSELPEGTTLEAILWMPSMNHGSAPVTVKRTSSSSFDITRVFFIMPGDWEVRIILKDILGNTLGRHTLEFVLP